VNSGDLLLDWASLVNNLDGDNVLRLRVLFVAIMNNLCMKNEYQLK
jgi:hypothetical protein